MKNALPFLLTLLFTVTAFAQSGAANTKTKKRRPAPTAPQPYYQLGTGAVMWQEFMEAKRGSFKSDMVTQSVGARLGLTYNEFYGPRSRWRKIYAADALIGTIKGKSSIFGQEDELNKQPWLAVMGTAGWVYRTSPATEIGFVVPGILRYISWDLQSGSSLKIEDSMFSVGAGALYTQRFSKQNALHISLVHQQLWRASLWTISWEQTL